MTQELDSAVFAAGRSLPLSAVLMRSPDGTAIEPAAGALVTVPSKPAADSALKRVFDVTLALVLLVILMPVLLTIALAIRLESRGPALFRQRRGGLHGVSFRIYKFRTMRVQEDDTDVEHAKRKDCRVTRFGMLLRRTSFDELPQLLNILKGEMSFVGPRPHALAHDAYYGAFVDRYVDRMQVRPGLTGLAQVSGLRGEIADLKDMETRVNYDLKYIEDWSITFDVKLIVLTAIRTPFDKRAY